MPVPVACRDRHGAARLGPGSRPPTVSHEPSPRSSRPQARAPRASFRFPRYATAAIAGCPLWHSGWHWHTATQSKRQCHGTVAIATQRTQRGTRPQHRVGRAMQMSGKHHNFRALAKVTQLFREGSSSARKLAGDLSIHFASGFLHFVVCPILRRTLITFSFSASNSATRTCTVSAACGG